MIDKLWKFFREDTSEVIGAYFDGDKLFIARLTDNFETMELDAPDAELDTLAEKISHVCKQKGWKESSVGFCLREGDAVTFQTEVGNIPDKELPAMVKSWAQAQAGAEAVSSFAKVGAELWMETLPRAKVEEVCAAFDKFAMNLRGLSVMPADMLTKVTSFDRARFISEVVRDKKAPNLLSARGNVWNWKNISGAAAIIFFIALVIGSAKLFMDYDAASTELNAAKASINQFREDLALKETLDADIVELHRLNDLAAQIDTSKNLNHLINLGRVASGDVRLTKVRVEENFMELEGLTDRADAVKNYLARVKASVIQSARLESSAERDDGEIAFVIRATL
ncbi:MAG: hypothetical protein IKD73_10145 [Selenomonadaceae bacterium]|nr:hypothetical protein [Selenomonadaceae bacterium]